MENWIVFDNCFIIVIQNNRDLKQTNEINKHLIFKGKSTQQFQIWLSVDKGALSIGKGQIYLVVYEYYVGSYQANRS